MLGEAMMEKPRAVILVLFALVLVFNSDPLMAQTADPGATTNQKLANEIVALRKRVEQLEKQNAELRGTIRDTKNKRSVEPTNMNGAVATADANVYAADLPRKAAPFVPAQVSDWSGVYMGIEGGYGWGKQSTDAIDPGAPFSAAFTSPSLHPGEVASLIPPTSFPDLAIPSTKQNGWCWAASSVLRSNGAAGCLALRVTSTALTSGDRAHQLQA
jgi:cell division protein FtsB